MGLAWLRGDGSRSERSRLWKSLSGWVGWGATSQQSSSVRRKAEAASMVPLGHSGPTLLRPRLFSEGVEHGGTLL